MATTESVSGSVGPRYAPEDPTLPKPWLGLVDGSRGTDCLYYWNPETNVTQYEKPASLTPPLPPGPPPSTPKLAQIPTPHSAQQPNGFLAQGAQSHIGQMPQQHGHGVQQQLAAQFSNQQGSLYGQMAQQSVQLRLQMMQYPGQQQQPGQGMQQQVVQQTSYQGGSHQNAQMVQGSNVYQQQQYMVSYQHGMIPQGQQNSQQQTRIGAQGFQYHNQPDYKAGLPNREETDFQQGKQTSFSPSQFQQPGEASSQTISTGNNTAMTPQAGVHATNTHQYSSSAVNAQKAGQFQQTETDFVHQQHGPQFQSQNRTRPPMMHNQQSNASHVGYKMSYENNMHGGSANNYHYNAKTEESVMSPPQSQPIANSMEPRMGAVAFQNAPTGYASGFNPSGHPMHNMYGHAVGGPPPNNALARTPHIGMQDIPNVSSAEVYCREHEVTATGDNVPAPFMTFEASGFPPEILRDIHAAGFLSPTPIQAQTWPIALQSRDIVAIAKTGSGKTLGYLIPSFILLRQLRNNPQNGPTVLVLAPTRELATQIQDEVIKFGRSSRVSCTCLYGGAPKGPQLRELDRGADIVVATPGRLNDILEMKKIDFRQVSLLVLDEADRMLDMGFEPQIRKIVNEIPPRRQTLMYTATWPKEVRKIASDLLVNPVQVNIGSVDELAANKSITQYVEIVPQMEKDRRLEQILRAQERGSKVIIFCSTKRLCDQLARGIGRNFGALAIHGNKSQNERDWVLNQFRSGKSPILVATDVAARGLDIKDIRVVINYDFPTGIEDYVHRIGRTGRAGATGMSYTFFTEQDWKYAADLVKVLEGANQHVPPEVREMALRGGPGLGKDRGGMGMGRFDSVGGRWDSGGHGGMRDGGFGGRGGMRDGGFGGRGGIRDGNFGGRGGMRDGGFGGRGGGRDGPFGGRGGRGDSFLGHGNRGRGFGGSAGGNVGWGRSERGPFDRHNMDGRGRGRGRGRFDGGRDAMDRSRGRSFSRSPDKVRTWDHSRSRSRSRSWSRSRSRSWSRSRSRSRTPRHSRSRSPRRNRSYSRSPRRSHSYSRSPRHDRSYSRNPEQKRSRSRSFNRFEKPNEMNHEKEAVLPLVEGSGEQLPLPDMSPMSPGTHGNAFSEQIPVVDNPELLHPEATAVAGPTSFSET